jgi:hypothetical protein
LDRGRDPNRRRNKLTERSFSQCSSRLTLYCSPGLAPSYQRGERRPVMHIGIVKESFSPVRGAPS